MGKSVDDILRELEGSGLYSAAPGGAPTRTAPPPVRRAAPRNRTLLLLAAILVGLIGVIPFGSLALYPFSMLVTAVHEVSHALVTVATGGTVTGIRLSPDLSGVTNRVAGNTPLIASAGYLGSTLVGAAMLLLPTRWARWAIGALAAFPLAGLFFHPDTPFTALWFILLALGLGLAAWKLPPRWSAFFQLFLAVEIGLNAVRDLLTLLFITGTGSHIQNNAQAMSNSLFGPEWMWAVLWTALSLAILLGALTRVWRRQAP